MINDGDSITANDVLVHRASVSKAKRTHIHKHKNTQKIKCEAGRTVNALKHQSSPQRKLERFVNFFLFCDLATKLLIYPDVIISSMIFEN